MLLLAPKYVIRCFIQDDLVRNLNYDYNQINIFPTLRFNYKFDQFTRFSFTYNGSARQPSITQLLCTRQLNNPLEVYVGNRNLKIGYNQNFNITYFNYKVLSGRSLYSGLGFSNSFNNITLNNKYRALGRSVNQYIPI
ncbi:MAG: outer membrane beta-barrel protein [Bacteroidetes bacterium]|nr:outer membrane beta-barrel protein [Bacteroidota bacterium]